MSADFRHHQPKVSESVLWSSREGEKWERRVEMKGVPAKQK